MREVFRGWRRKTGCICLLFALIWTAIWLRSRLEVDFVTIRSSRTFDRLSTPSQGLKWERLQAVRAPDFPPTARFEWKSYRVTTSFRTSAFDMLQGIQSSYTTTSTWQAGGFQCDVGYYGGAMFVKYGFWVIPYWSLTTVPTLLAAFLLLGKPRPRDMQPQGK